MKRAKQLFEGGQKNHMFILNMMIFKNFNIDIDKNKNDNIHKMDILTLQNCYRRYLTDKGIINRTILTCLN